MAELDYKDEIKESDKYYGRENDGDEKKKKNQEELERLKKFVRISRDFYEENYKRLNADKEFTFVTTLSKELRGGSDTTIPPINCNLGHAYVSRLRGEFVKTEPSIQISAREDKQVDNNLINFLQGNFRYEENKLRKEGIAEEFYTDMLCGYAVGELYTYYKNPKTFDQDIGVRRVEPDMCGFDPLAVASHKGDGRYWFKLYPKVKEDLEQERPNLDLSKVKYSKNIEGFNWSYINDSQEKVLLLCEFYERKKKPIKLVRVAMTPYIQSLGIGDTMKKSEYNKLIKDWDKLNINELPPEKIDEREDFETVFCRTLFIEDQILDYKETSFPEFNLIFGAGNKVRFRATTGEIKELTLSYIHNVKGAQKLADVSMQSIGQEMQNSVQHKFIVAAEGIPPQYKDAYTNYQIPSVLVYNAFLDKEGVTPGSVAIPPPREVVRPPMPPEFLQTLQFSFQLFQNILGSFDASIGINNNQLSSLAVIESATQSNSAAMPIIANYMVFLSRIFEVYIKMLPRYVVTPRSMPVLDHKGVFSKQIVNQGGGVDLNYDDYTFDVKIEAGPSYQVQKTKTLQQMIMLSQSIPVINEFMNYSENMLVTLVKLLEWPGAENMIPELQQFLAIKKQQQQQAMQRPDPNTMKVENEKMNIEREAKKDEIQAHIQAADLAIRNQENELERTSLALKAHQAHADNIVALDKHETEKQRTKVEMAIAAADMSHRHSKDIHELNNKISDTILKHRAHERKESKKHEEVEIK